MSKIKEKIDETGRKVEQFCENHFNTIACSAIGMVTGGMLLVMHSDKKEYKNAMSKMTEEYAKSLRED